MLEEVERMGRNDILSWMPHGRAFKIHDERAFEATILPRYFKATLASFTRWLHHWGFIRILTGKDRKSWYHRLFVRGVTELIRDFTRQELFDAMKGWRDLGTEPDFYCSGTAVEISETPSIAQTKREVPDQKSTNALRGTIVEDLREMLESAQVDGNTHIVSWLPHGKAFKVHNPGEFEAKIMRLFFKASKYRYFADVLRSWGFVKLKNGRDKGAYYHKYFIKDEPKLSHYLSRAQMKASMKNWSKKNQNVQDFYHGLQPEQKLARNDAHIE
eukprot:jgi/Psemu1/303716/fgenesh1_kg.120_\